MDSFLKLVQARQSDRAFDVTRPVEREKIERMLEAVRLSPSANNSQPWHLIVVDDPKLRDQIADATSNRLLGLNHFSKQAPVHIIIVEESAGLMSAVGGWAKNKHFPHLDLGIATAHLCLAASDEGLGSCILGWFDEDKVKKLLNIPSNKRVLLDITIGYSIQPMKEKKRKSLEEIVSYNGW